MTGDDFVRRDGELRRRVVLIQIEGLFGRIKDSDGWWLV